MSIQLHHTLPVPPSQTQRLAQCSACLCCAQGHLAGETSMQTGITTRSSISTRLLRDPQLPLPVREDVRMDLALGTGLGQVRTHSV